MGQVTTQWPDVGRKDVYYGGTIYENTQGLGSQLMQVQDSALPAAVPEVASATGEPDGAALLAVPR